jgi:hypothetical protein
MILKAMVLSLIFAVTLSATSLVYADNTQTRTTVTQINDLIGVEKTILPFHASSQNKLPWGFVEGRITNPVEGYPVVIQFYKNGEPVHFAQTDVKKDGTYEYKFRVRDVTDNKVTMIFEGDYTVKIFKVVYLTKDSTST